MPTVSVENYLKSIYHLEGQGDERVLDQEPDVLRYLDSIGLTPSTRLEVDEVVPIDGQMTISLDDETRTVSKSLASRLLVTEMTDET